MTALAMASLLAHLQRGTLVNAAASARTHHLPGRSRLVWMGLHPTAAASFTVTGCKIGESPSGSAFVGNVPEGAWLRQERCGGVRARVAERAREPSFLPVFRAIDAVVRNWP